MRLQLQLTPNTDPVPFDHLHQLTGALHKWLGPNNDQHDGLSLYSFGWLRGGESRNGALRFPKGAQWNISFYDDAIAHQLVQGALKATSVAYGMRVMGLQLLPTPSFGETYHFKTDGSAILARKPRPDGTRAYLLWDDPAADEVLTHMMRQKLLKAGFTEEHLRVEVGFDRTYKNARTKLATVKNTQHKGSECPVVISGTTEAIQFAWMVGIGDLTGSGFGGIQ